MEDDQTSLRSTDAKQWERPWSTAEIRENSANWTLAGDIGLLQFLQEYAHNLMSRTHETEKMVNEVVYKNKAVGAKVNNVINDFQMLSNEQFIENRVYDEEIQDSKTSTDAPEIQKTKEQREAEMIPRVTQALDLGLSVLDQAFHKVQVEETSDSEEDECRVEEGHIVLEPKDPYEHRPLPFIIGSEEFNQDDLVGLRDLHVEDIVEKMIDEESVSLASLSSSSLDESDVEIETPYPREAVTTKDYVQEIERPKSSGSESSDLFDLEKEGDDFTSNLEAEDRLLKENEQNQRLNTDDLVKEVRSVIKNKIEPDVPKVSQTPKQEKYDDDLFGSVESDNIIDENSPFQKKSHGLFSTDLAFTNGKDDVSDDDDLFGTNEKSHVISSKSETTLPQAVASSEETKAPDLFGESEDENEDIFTALSSTKKSFSVAQPSSTIIKDEKNETAKSFDRITPVPDLTKKKSNNAFTDFDDKSSSDSLFGDDPAMDDLFITKPEKKLGGSHFMAEDKDDSDLFSSLKINYSDSLESKKDNKEPKEEKHSQQSTRPAESTLFGVEDDDSFDLFGSTKMPYTISSPRKDTSNMFDTENEISTKKTDPLKEVSPIRTASVKEAPKIADFVRDTHTKAPDTMKDTSAKNLVPSKEPSTYKKTTSSRGSTPPVAPRSVKEIPNKKLPIVENQVDTSASFDEPMDPRNTLNAINKGRAKIPGKRRKPTRKTRRASLTSDSIDSEIEESTKKTVETNSSPARSDLIVPEDDSDLFNSTTSDVKSSDLQITPKKLAPFGINKNIMSQLVSEIGNSKVGKTGSLSETRGSFEDDDDDDFFSLPPDDQISSKTSEFLPVSPDKEILVEKSPTSPVMKAQVTENKILDSDSTLEDELFSEPAFKGFRTSVSGRDSIFGLDDDDIFKVVEANKQKSSIPSAESSDDIFAYPEDDIFAEVGKEKYELISNQLCDDDDDIFGNLDASTKQATSGSNTKKTAKVEAPKKEPVDIFDDPLTGFASD